MTQPTCPICKDTGIASSAPYIVGTPYSHTMTACTCEAAKRLSQTMKESTQ